MNSVLQNRVRKKISKWIKTHHISCEKMALKKSLINPVDIVQWKHDVADIQPTKQPRKKSGKFCDYFEIAAR